MNFKWLEDKEAYNAIKSRDDSGKRIPLEIDARIFGPPELQEWGVYEVEIKFPDHPSEPWKSGVLWEVSAANPETAVKKAAAESRKIYGLGTRLRVAYKLPKRVIPKRSFSPKHAVQLPSPFSVQQ